MSENISLQNVTVCSNESSVKDPGAADSTSMFGDGSCGEPLLAQHLMIDFTPGDEDNEYVQKKCCAFWDFIKSHPELQGLMALPEPTMCNAATTITPSSSTTKTSDAVKSNHNMIWNRTAVSMLRHSEARGLIDRIFEAKLPQSMCSLGTREYVVEDLRPKNVSLTNTKSVCSCGAKCAVCQARQTSQPTSTSSKVRGLCSTMKGFDEEHPKSFIPIGHAPALSHSIMQRKINTNY